MNNQNCIFNRRSVRQYTGQPISFADIQVLVHAGMAAPSAKNSQPWEFLVVQEKETLQKLSKVRPYWAMLKNAAAAIVVLANLSEYKSTRDFFMQDCAAATQNILLAAESIGLGGCWLGCYPTFEGTKGTAEILGIPPSIIPFSVVSLGYPAAHPEPHSVFKDEKVHYEKY